MPMSTRAILAYAGIALSDALVPVEVDGAPIATVAVRRGTVRAACGSSVLATDEIGCGRFSTLIIPAAFIRSPDFAAAEAVRRLADAVASAGEVMVMATSIRDARRAHLLLRRPPMMASGRFFERLADWEGPGTTVVRDAHTTWAVGPTAGRAVARLLRPASLLMNFSAPAQGEVKLAGPLGSTTARPARFGLASNSGWN